MQQSCCQVRFPLKTPRRQTGSSTHEKTAAEDQLVAKCRGDKRGGGQKHELVLAKVLERDTREPNT